jgi:hypothetical protein
MSSINAESLVGEYHVKDFSYVAAATANNAGPINAAIQRAVANGAGRVVLPSGVTVGVRSSVVLYDDIELVIPSGTTLKLLNGANCDVIKNADQTTGNSRCKVTGGGTIDGNRANNTSTLQGINFVKVTDALIDGVIVKSCHSDGIKLDTCIRPVVNAKATDNGTDGIELATTILGKIEGAFYDNSKVSAAGVGDGVYLSGASTDNTITVIAYDSSADAKRQGYGVREADGSNCDHNTIGLSSLSGNLTGDYSLVGASSRCVDIDLGEVLVSDYADLPIAGTAGRLAQVTDDVRGIWADNGSQWVPLNKKVINVLDFGAKGDGATDDTAAMQAAHNTGKVVFYPQGRYKFTTISIPSGGIIGAGKATILDSTDTTTGDVITYLGQDSTNLLVNDLGAVFKDFYLRVDSTTQKTAGAGIRLDPTATGYENFTSIFSGLTIRNLPICISTTISSFITIRDCYFALFTVAGVYEDNNAELFEDNGDNIIIGNEFYTNQSNAIGIRYRGGGARIIGNKINSGFSGIDISPLRSTSIVIIEGNSIEGQTNTCIRMITEGDTAATAFSQVAIIGNQINGYANPVALIQIAPTAFSLSELNIQNNICRYYTSNNNAIVVNKTGKFIISGNQIDGNSTGYRGIYLAATATNGKVYGNNYTGLTQTILNDSASTDIELFVQRGAKGVTAGTTYGSLFTGYSDVTFSTAYRSAPNVRAQIVDVPGNCGISTLISNVTTTGFRLHLINYVNGAACNIEWKAEGLPV